jgi:hypothetical protein
MSVSTKRSLDTKPLSGIVGHLSSKETPGRVVSKMVANALGGANRETG